MTTAVKYFHHGVPGAPSLSNTAGSLLAVLQACLVDGWGSATVDSLVVSGGVATVTIAAGHPFEPGAVASIAGATVTGGTVNGEQRVLSTTSNSYTFDATGIPNQAATGVITHKLAPLGFARPYNSGNVSVFRSADMAGTRLFLRIDDTGTTTARAVGYEDMTDVNSGTGPFPTGAQASGGLHVLKRSSGGGNADWVLVGDSRGWLMNVRHQASGYSTWGFGDVRSRKAADGWACALAAAASDLTGSAGVTLSDLLYQGSSTAHMYVARGSSGVGGSVQLGRGAWCPVLPATAANYSGGEAGGHVAYPNVADNALLLSDIHLTEASGTVLRGELPGLYYCPQRLGSTHFAAMDKVTGITGLTGRTLIALVCGGGGAFGRGFVDVTGPWR